MKCYISGKITGTEDYIKRFKGAEIAMKLMGYEVVNPAELNAEMPPETPHEVYMQRCMTYIKDCDAICMIDGWESGPGANREYGYALGKDMDIYYMGNGGLEK